MKEGNGGFTLIELVVVCLIIGILGAFAVAQYNKTTEKGRMAEAFSAITALRSAQNRYVLKYNAYTSASSDLDQAPPTTKYYDAPTLTGTPANYTIAFARSVPVNSNYGPYVVSYIGPEGTFSCSNASCAQDLLP